MLALKVAAALVVVLVCGVAGDFSVNDIKFGETEEEAPPKPCCVPAAFEGMMSVVAGERIRWHDTASFGNCTFHFDSKNKRLATETTMYREKRRTDVNVIEVGDAMYIIFPKYKKCKKLKAKPMSNCLPKDATFVGSVTLGGLGAPSVPINSFMLNPHNRTVFSTISVTKAKCVPLSTLNMGAIRRYKFTEIESYFNLKQGIKDVKVFNPPDYCKKAEWESMSDDLEPYTDQHLRVLAYLRQ